MFFFLWCFSFPHRVPLSVSCLPGCLSWCYYSGRDHHLKICKQLFGQFTMPFLNVNPSSKPVCSPVWLTCVLLGILAICAHAKVGKNKTICRENGALNIIINQRSDWLTGSILHQVSHF